METPRADIARAKTLEVFDETFTAILPTIPGLKPDDRKRFLESYSQLRRSFREAISSVRSRAELAASFSGVDDLNEFLKAAQTLEKDTNLASISRVTQKDVQRWKQRRTMPILQNDKAKQDKDSFSEQVQDILSISDLQRVSKECLEAIVIGSPEAESSMGDLDENTHQIFISHRHHAQSKSRYELARTIIHEMGHAMMNRLRALPKGQELFDAYVAHVAFATNQGAAVYPEAMALRLGRINSDAIKEAFAEDFRLLIEYPPLLSPARLAILQKIWTSLFRDISLEEVQQKTRKMYGTLYGIDPGKIQERVTPEKVQRMARALDRMEAEDNRE